MMLSILIPCKDATNEPKVSETITVCEELFPGAEIIIANDRYGYGKGWAVRQALSQAHGHIICFIDGDMDIHPKMIKRLLPFLEDYNIVVGRKQIRGLISRRILTVLSRKYIQFLFGLNIDTQTGIKLFRRDSLPSWDSDGFLFDVEILLKASRANMSIIEVPVEVTIERKMKFKSIWKCWVESLKIWINK